MVKRVYCDTNVYDAVSRDRELFRRIHRNIEAGSISLLPSIFNCEEPLLVADRDSPTFWRVLSAWEKLTSGKRLILPSAELLDKEVDAALRRTELVLDDKLLAYPTVDDCCTQLRKAFKNGELSDSAVRRVIKKTRSIKISFEKSMRSARNNALREKAKTKGWNPSLDEYCASVEYSMGRSLVERLGYRWELTDDIMIRMMKARSLRLAIRVNAFLVHRQAVVEAKPRSGDGRDVHQVIASSVAEVFVSNDRVLRKGLTGIDLENYEVCSLDDFIEGIPA